MSNLGPKALAELLGDRLYDRVRSKCVPMLFAGPSMRKPATADLFRLRSGMSDSAWTLLMIMLAPVVFINLVLFGLLVRAALQISKETKLTDRLKRRRP